MNIKKLQRVVVDALEDVKAQDIRVFDTVGLTALFDAVAIASGTSNRQTRALAHAVRDKVKAAGGQVISVEGEDTGEWVLVDLGDMVVHIMQPAIRTYYNLEELWGTKPVNPKALLEAAAKKAASAAAKKTAGGPAAKKAPAKKVAAKTGIAKRGAAAGASTGATAAATGTTTKPAAKKAAVTGKPATGSAGTIKTRKSPASKTAARPATARATAAKKAPRSKGTAG